MCENHGSNKNKSFLSSSWVLLLAAICGLVSGWLDISEFNQVAQVVSDIFIRLLKLISLPIIFFSLLSTLSGMGSASDVKQLGGRVIKYTLLTTVLAATIALILYVSLDPAHIANAITGGKEATQASGYWSYLMSVIPSNFVEPFYTNNVMGVLFLAILMSAATISLGKEHKEVLHHLFDSLFAVVMKMTHFILKLMPLAVWAFVTMFVHDVQDQTVLRGLALYLLCVVLANFVQALVVLPLLLRYKGLSPIYALKAMWPALTVAFFSKSSSAALPSAVDCAEKRMGVQHKVARFSLPLCITTNMNGCAGFILITVLFVSQSNGVTYSPIELVSWIFIASIAAIGNAGVPMGCYMLSSAFLAAMGVPLQLMVVILPFYAFIDMLESAINVWSDSCVTAMVNKDLDDEGILGEYADETS